MKTKNFYFLLFFCFSFINFIQLQNIIAANERATVSSALEVGTSMVEITPEIGFEQYNGNKSTGVASPLYAKALVLKQGDVRGALLICDLISMSRSLSSLVRSEVSKQTGIPFHNISITATHIHTGPTIRERDIAQFIEGKNIEGQKKNYVEFLFEKMVKALVDANNKVIPTDVYGGVGKVHGLAFNRRYLMKNGKVRFNPGFLNPDIVFPAGPVDSTVNFILFRPIGKKEVFSSLTVYPLHCDTKNGSEFHRDFPFYLQEEMKKIFGKQIVSLFGQGTSGNINHFNVKLPSEKNTYGARTETIGVELTKTIKATESSSKKLVTDLKIVSKTIYLPIQNYTEEDLKWALDKNSENPYPEERSWLTQRRKNKIINLRNVRKEAIPPYIKGEYWHLPIEIHVFKIDDQNAIVTLPGELFVEFGLAIEEKSPFANTLVIELANSRINYVPTINGYKEGDYEGINNILVPGSGEKMVECALDILQSIKNSYTKGSI